jgi:polyhydroxybutyrate depolymerase
MLQKCTFIIFLSLTAFFLCAQTTTGTIEHDGITRDYILHLPAGYDASQSYPFVYNLHGFTSNAQQQQFYSAMDITSDVNGFIVCYPNGVDNSWNVGWNFGSNADDVGFLLTLVDALAEDYNINYDRLYSCGMSNGGFMSYVLACEESDKFAAIASVTGSIVPSELEACNPIRKIPVMQIHGTADPTVVYNGSLIGAPIEDVVNFWAEKNVCDLMADTIQIEDINNADQCTAERIQYTDCEDDTEVVLYKIDGGEHTWPDAAITIGVTNRDFNASQEIWNFFNRFDLNGAIISSNENIAQTPEILLFPNPMSSQFTLSNLPFDTKKITIIDAFGKTIFSQIRTREKTENISVEHFANGLYFVIIEGENTRELVKFVKQ